MNSPKEMMNTILILLLCALFSSTSHAVPQNFCKADLKLPQTPTGYPCLPSESVTAGDFKSSFNGKPGIPVLNNATLYSAAVEDFPIINGGRISGGLVEIAPGGSLPLHTHGANEILIVMEGIIKVGLLEPRRAYQNTLRARDFTYFPEGQPHYLINSGPGIAVAFAAYSRDNPPFNFVHLALFSNDVPSRILARVSFLDEPQIRKNKARFNGTG
ncbi:germin-like protein 1 [Vigna radiata var. radiata]|uniref:Germin-like protein n=1 Tax=Vigna radiata var. radiata TaxID=3916 RepID=A0A1S3VAI5_VIGRR|nr:germin-like protein 1 [Vigna radiata var. radiata]